MADKKKDDFWVLVPRQYVSHEVATVRTCMDRTREDYIRIISEGQQHSFGEYDRTSLLLALEKEGVIEIDPTKQSVRTSMNTSLWYRMKGR